MSIVPFTSQRQSGMGNATRDKGIIYGPVEASIQGAALAYRLQKNPKKREEKKCGADAGWSLQVGRLLEMFPAKGQSKH